MFHDFTHLLMIMLYKAVELPGKIKSCYDYSVLDSKICFLLFIEQILYLALFVNWQLQHSEQEFERELLMGCIHIWLKTSEEIHNEGLLEKQYFRNPETWHQ